MARSIDRACPTLNNAETNGQLQGDQVDLANTCTQMIMTVTPPGDGLGISDEQMNDALQTVNGEELQAPQQQVVDVQNTLVSSLTARVDALRTGTVGPGLSLAGLSFSDGDSLLAADDLAESTILPAQWADGTWLSRVGVFATGTVILGNKDETSAADGYDFQTTGLTVGADYRFSDALVLGAAFGYSFYDVDFDNTPSWSGPGQQQLCILAVRQLYFRFRPVHRCDRHRRMGRFRFQTQDLHCEQQR
jgi:outer membrane autotransporter protein